MFVYEKKLQYPVKIKNTNPALAKFIISQYGGPYCSILQYLCRGLYCKPRQIITLMYKTLLYPQKGY